MLNARAGRGFTLVECLVVVAVIAILSTLAFPSYLQHLLATRRLEAIGDIGRIVQAQERFRSQQPRYGERLIVIAGVLRGVGRAGDVGAAVSMDAPRYRLSVQDAGADSHTVLATALGAQAADHDCQVLRLRMAGSNLEFDAGPSMGELHGAASAAARRCWRRP